MKKIIDNEFMRIYKVRDQNWLQVFVLSFLTQIFHFTIVSTNLAIIIWDIYKIISHWKKIHVKSDWND